MHNESLPPSDRDEVAAPIDSKRSLVKTYPCNEVIRQRLRQLRSENTLEYSNAQLGAKLGYSSAVMSQYLSDDGNKYPANIAGLEKKAEDFLQALARRRASGVATNPSKVADELFEGVEDIRKTNILGAIIAESGDGKSRGIELVLEKLPLAILIEVTEWNRNVHDIKHSLWTACAVDGWDRQTPQFPYLVQKMRGTDRLIIFDDAHKASRDALSLIATFQEKTKCPIPLIGLPELVDKLASDPQRLSRTGVCWTIKPETSTDRKLLLHMIRSIAKDINGELDELLDLCTQTCKGHGHKRTVEQILKRAAEHRHVDPDLSWCDAYRDAHKLSIKPCTLK
jgi:DNA transposition AAA+ family ATPase